MNSWMDFLKGFAGDLQPVPTLILAVVLIGASVGCGVSAYNRNKRQSRHRHTPSIGSRLILLAYLAGAVILLFIGASLILASLG